MSNQLDDEKHGGTDEDEDLATPAGEAGEDDEDDAADGAEEASLSDGEEAPAAGAEVDADGEADLVHPDDAAAAAKPRPAIAIKQAPLDPQARDGLIRCLQARLLELDATLAHATEVAARDAFYSRWPNVVSELRSQALKRLEELQRS